MPTLVSTAQITLTDQNDYIFTRSTPPKNPIANVTLWIDTSVTPSQQKRWTGSVWEIVNEVIVGGRNLIHSPSRWAWLGGFVWNASNNSILETQANYYSPAESNPIQLEVNTYYTLSFNCLQLSGDFFVELQSRPDGGLVKQWIGRSVVAGKNVITFFCNQTLPAGDTHYTLRLFGTSQTLSVLCEVKDIQLEKGNKATDWTPAPEDIDVKIDDIEVDGRNYATGIKRNRAVTENWSVIGIANLIAGQKYRISVRLKPNAGTQISILVYESSTNYGLALNPWGSVGVFTTGSAVFTAANTGAWAIYAIQYNGSPVDFVVDYVMITKGEKMFDFTPAIEDVQAQFDALGNENLIQDSRVEATSNVYGFAHRSVQVTGGVVYTFSVNGRCNSVSAGKRLRVYIYNAAWSYSQFVEVATTNDTTASITFTAPASEMLSITAYYFDDTAGRDGTVTVNWYKLEVGNKATAWRDRPGDVPVALRYLNEALQNDPVVLPGIDIGLLFSKIIQMRDTLGSVHSGMSGLAGDNIGFWTGGTYADALANIAKIILRKDGSGQLAGGNLWWDVLGQLFFGKTGDSETIRISTESIPSLAEIGNKEHYVVDDNYTNNVQKYYSNPADSPYIPTISRTVNFETENDAILNLYVDFIAGGSSEVTGVGLNGSIIFQKFVSGLWTTLESGVFEGSTAMYLALGDYAITKGKYRVVSSGESGGTPAGTNPWIGLSTTSDIRYQLNVKKLVIGIDGIALFDSMSDKYIRLSLKDNVAQLRMKLDTDIPGVLLAGDGNAGGGGAIRFGAKKHATNTVEKLSGTGYYRVWHTIGHSAYTVQLTMKASGLNAMWENPNNSYFDVRIYSGTTPANANFSFVAFGDN